MTVKANEVFHATDDAKQERKFTRAEGVRLSGAQAGDRAFLLYIARKKFAQIRCNGQAAALLSSLDK